jgi:Uma2 family endonuclease
MAGMTTARSPISQATSITLRNVSWKTYEMLRRDTDEQHLFITYDTGKMVLDRRGEEVGVLENIRWETYERLLRDTEAQKLRLTYDQGRLTIVSPTHKHDKVKTLIGQMIELTALEFRIPVAYFGSATWRREDVWKGLEADECYYIANEAIVRGKEEIDLALDPPPDLAVEVEITHQDIDRFNLYAAIGVRELWHFRNEHLRGFQLEGGAYVPIEKSIGLPMIRPTELERFLRMRETTDVTSIMVAFQEWLQSHRP